MDSKFGAGARISHTHVSTFRQVKECKKKITYKRVAGNVDFDAELLIRFESAAVESRGELYPRYRVIINYRGAARGFAGEWRCRR